MNTLPPFASESHAARAAQSAWATRPLAERLAILRRFRQSLPGACDELCAAVEADVGRPPHEVIGTDLLPLASAGQYAERRAVRLLAARRVPFRDTPVWLWGQCDSVHRVPLGVVGIIGTWNYPLFLNGVQIVQALAAGNAVLWKPSEFGASSAVLLHRLLLEAGVPAGLFARLPATREAGPQLAEADVDHVVFTGAARTGAQLAKRLGERLIPSTLELSGVDALVVMGDADVAFAAQAAWYGVRLNRGQTCLAVRRAFVPSALVPAFVAALRPLVEASPPMRLVQASQVEQADRLVADAVAHGASVIGLSPAAGDGRTCGPRVVVGGSPMMMLCVEECFAPLIAVLPYENETDLRQQVDRCEYGLGASVFGRDVAAAERLARSLPAGAVSVNDCIVPTAHPATPFGGLGRSGWGVTQGAEGLLAMTTPRVVSVRGGRFRPHFLPPSAALGEVTRGLLEWGHAPTLTGRWAGLRRVIANGRRL